MRKSGCAIALLMTSAMAMPAFANDDVIKNTSDAKQWAIPT